MGPNEVLDKGFVATTAIPWYHVVTQADVEDCAVVDAAGEDWLGICQEEADALDVTRGRVVRVRMMGISRGVASAAIPIRSRVAAAADGRLAVATTGQEIVGIALTAAAAAGDWIDVQLTPGAGASA